MPKKESIEVTLDPCCVPWEKKRQKEVEFFLPCTNAFVDCSNNLQRRD